MYLSLKRLLALILIATLLFAFLFVILIEIKLRPIFHSISKTKVSTMVTKLVNQAIQQKSKEFTYGDLVKLKTDAEGNVVFMQPNIQKINHVSSRLALEIQSSLKKIKGKDIELPLLQVFGIDILADYGPKLDVRVIPYSSINTDIVDYFQSAGINQTRHKIDLQVIVNTRVVIPFLSEDIQIDTTVPLTEAVIVGDVPEVYVDLKNGLFGSSEADNKTNDN
ncbi:sporulation protein YunB [Acetohalobium arabaticum]|uniref:Sporulation protein YunB n=1 Tax=Acetohalobium arabaticum (strain ATCC 49924 / DSM 5501 / Z-7288) TaxID=574087 RepID=D9QUP5_ACEAZ|nr:sporulation protein YunB [Acetohalobium arabaticum]ADL11954.1 sporulation protein YunB [Acetohalobium arabaticum DSM 5501]